MRRSLVVLVIALGLVAAVTVGPAVAGAPEWPEERIVLLCGFEGVDPCIEEFPANVPFFVIHGIGFEPGPGANDLKRAAPAFGHFDFNLYVDGVEVEEDWTYHHRTYTWGLYIFPEGMTGDHVLTGEWVATCTLDDIGVVEGCALPSDTLPVIVNSVPISFVP